MKILIIASLFRPYSRGGAEVVVENIVDELKKKHEVTVLTVQPWHGWSSWKWLKLQEEGISVIRFTPLNIFSFIHINAYPFAMRLIWHFFDAFNIHSYFIVQKLLALEKPDCILTHNLKGIGLPTLLAIKQSRLRWIHTAHDVALCVPSGLLMYGKERQQRSFQIMTRVVHRFFFGSPDVVLFPSTYLKHFYERYGFFRRSKKIVLVNPLPTHFIDTIHMNMSRETRSFLFVGQLEEHKGIRLLLKSFHAIDDPNSYLVIVGDGSMEPLVRKALQKDSRIVYRGKISNTEVAHELAKAYFSVLPTLCYENSPMVILESMGCGTPCIVSNIGGCAEHIQDGVSGYIVPPNDCDALTQAFEKALALSIAEYKTFSQCASETIKQLLSKDYFSTLEMLIKKKRSTNDGLR